MAFLHRGKIVDGRIQKFLAEQSLLEQDFIKDTSKTVATVIKEATAAVGEKISVRRFERYSPAQRQFALSSHRRLCLMCKTASYNQGGLLAVS